jgi:hypothetical protein
VDIGDEGYIICESPEQSSRCDASSNQSALRGALRMSECLLRSPVPRNVDLPSASPPILGVEGSHRASRNGSVRTPRRFQPRAIRYAARPFFFSTEPTADQ